MKPLLLFITIAALATGCGEKSKSDATSRESGSSPLNAPADYVGGLAKGQQSAVKTVDTRAIQQAIQLFNVDKGRNPKDLNELVTAKYLPTVPEPPSGMKLQYDAEAGTVSITKP
jgi:hypothetical protein